MRSLFGAVHDCGGLESLYRLLLEHLVQAARAGGDEAKVWSLLGVSLGLLRGKIDDLRWGGRLATGTRHGIVSLFKYQHLCGQVNIQPQIRTNEVGVFLQLENLHPLARLVLAHEVETRLFERLD